MHEPNDPWLDSKILVVEDDVAIQQLLIAHFLEMMFLSNITFAGDGVEGLEFARKLKPDLIILDIEMPRMNGLEMLRHLRADPELATIPVIIQSAEQSSERREQMFELGATDFVLKPLNGKEFQGRVRVHLENLLHLRRLQSDLVRIDQELQDAASLQRALLPTDEQLRQVEQRYGLITRAVFEPSSRLGGDFWGIMPIDDSSVGVFLCDFAGHGVSAAMSTFQLHTMIERLPPPNPKDPSEFVSNVNAALHRTLNHRHYATFLFAIIDIANNRLNYASAAAPDPLVGRRGSASLTLLDGSGIPVGLSADASYENRQVEFPPGSLLFLYSDALTETVLFGDAPAGLSGVEERVAAVAAPATRQAEPLQLLLGSAARRRDDILTDDLTAVWIERF